jgi:hypothetical protein
LKTQLTYNSAFAVRKKSAAVYYLKTQPTYNTFAAISCISLFKSNFKSGKSLSLRLYSQPELAAGEESNLQEKKTVHPPILTFKTALSSRTGRGVLNT